MAERAAANGTRRAARAACWPATPRSGRASDEASWLGWLGVVEQQLDDLTARSRRCARRSRREGFTHALLLGMGGSSLCPEVLAGDVRRVPGLARAARPRLDRPRAGAGHRGRRSTSTKTLFIVSSKSGSTLEPNIFKAYFFERVKQALGADKAGSRFVAITDPGSSLEKEARGRRLPPRLPGPEERSAAATPRSPTSAWCPAAAMGLDVERAARRGRAHAAGVRARRARGGEPRPRAGHDPGRGRAARASTS